MPFWAGPSFRVELPLPLNEPADIVLRRNQLSEPPQLLNRTVDRDRADPAIQLGHVGFHIFGGDMRPRGRFHVEPTRPCHRLEKEAIALAEVALHLPLE